MLPDHLLSTTNLAVHRGTQLLVDELSCSIGPFEAVWLTGPNGVGKSTLLRVLAGVQPPLRGRVTINSDFIYQPSDTGFDAGLTITQDLEWWAVLNNGAAMSVAEALAQWQLIPQAHQPYASLSQGQKQRAALARLSLSPAKLWLLDEPLAHLDQQGEQMFHTAVTAHLAKGGAMIAATHITALLPQARIIQLGPASV